MRQNGTDRYIIGIDIGGTNIRMGAVTERLQVAHSIQGNSRALLDTGDPLGALAGMIGDFIAQISGRPAGICIGFPGAVAKDKATVLSCPNIPLFDGIDIRAPLEAEFQVPVIAEHDVVFLLCNDMQRLGLFHSACVIAVYAGTGIGNALYVNGSFLDGKNGVAGELGHIPVFGSSALCPCGKRGCLEAHTCGNRLVQLQKEHFPEVTDLEALFRDHRDHPALVDFLEYLAVAVAIEINIFDPDVVLLGGGVINMRHFPYDDLLRRIRAHVRRPYPLQDLNLQRSPVDPVQGIRGAGIYFWNKEQKHD